MNYLNLNKKKLLEEKETILKKYKKFKNLNLNLNMTRGKPSPEQVNLSKEMLNIITSESSCISEDGIDCLNYGLLDGLSELKEIFEPVLGVKKEQIFVGGNSSLSMMFDTISFFMTHGVCGNAPWQKLKKIKFLCPCPGYDRHFTILRHFDIEPISIEMTTAGPNMDMIEQFVSNDETIKGIWCVPKYSNPQGITYSDDTVKRLAALKPLAPDFRIFWDNAYAVHSFSDKSEKLLNIMEECQKNNSEDLPIIFCSTSKITFPGAGVAFLGASDNNIKEIKKMYSFKTIGFNKINQLRHALYFKNYQGLLNHMKKHSNILKPKFDAVINTLKTEFNDNKIIAFTEPSGGYFISVDVMNGCAKRVVELCKNIGLILTDAGATFPNGFDKNDSNIRLAPSYPNINELKLAMLVFCTCVKLATLEKLLKDSL